MSQRSAGLCTRCTRANEFPECGKSKSKICHSDFANPIKTSLWAVSEVQHAYYILISAPDHTVNICRQGLGID